MILCCFGILLITVGETWCLFLGGVGVDENIFLLQNFLNQFFLGTDCMRQQVVTSRRNYDLLTKVNLLNQEGICSLSFIPQFFVSRYLLSRPILPAFSVCIFCNLAGCVVKTHGPVGVVNGMEERLNLR